MLMGYGKQYQLILQDWFAKYPTKSFPVIHKELKELNDTGTLESDATSELPNNLLNRIVRFFRRILHAMNL